MLLNLKIEILNHFQRLLKLENHEHYLSIIIRWGLLYKLTKLLPYFIL